MDFYIHTLSSHINNIISPPRAKIIANAINLVLCCDKVLEICIKIYHGVCEVFNVLLKALSITSYLYKFVAFVWMLLNMVYQYVIKFKKIRKTGDFQSVPNNSVQAASTAPSPPHRPTEYSPPQHATIQINDMNELRNLFKIDFPSK